MRGEYNTRQKRELLNFLEDHELEHFSVDDVVLQMHERGEKIGRSTIYRYLELLAEQGSVRKYQNAQGMTQYQHVDDEASCSDHFHMMCKQCGELYHVDCGLMKSLTEHIAKVHGFQLDAKETVLVGICARCAGREIGEDADHGIDHDGKCHHCL